MVQQMITVNKRIEMFMKIMLKSGVNEDFTAWLIDQGFFTAPASTKYHGNYEGGLFDHSLAVTESLVEITEKMGLEWEHPRSPYIVGMFHDLCKMDQYEKIIDVDGIQYMGMDEAKGEESHWEYRSDSLFPGHGDKSIMKLASWLQLTEEEILCIRYHMGAYEKESWDYYDRAIKKYQTVLWTHTADMVASKVKGV
jgi:HD superfamily phosphohydrolase YqeK